MNEESPNPKTVLLVDDNPDIQTVIPFSLERSGYTVIGVTSGEAAVATLADSVPDIAIIDFGLPEMDGIDVGREIRKAAGDRHVSLILFSGTHDPEVQTRANAVGFDLYLVKPVRMNVLLEHIQSLNPPACD